MRRALAEDAASIAELSQSLGYPTVPEDIASRLTRLDRSSDHAVFVAESEHLEVILAWVHVSGVERLESGRFAELGGLVVADSERRKGVGRRLVEAARNWASENGYDRLRVRSNAKRQGAREFYLRLGFKTTKTQRVYDLKAEPGADLRYPNR